MSGRETEARSETVGEELRKTIDDLFKIKSHGWAQEPMNSGYAETDEYPPLELRLSFVDAEGISEAKSIAELPQVNVSRYLIFTGPGTHEIDHEVQLITGDDITTYSLGYQDDGTVFGSVWGQIRGEDFDSERRIWSPELKDLYHMLTSPNLMARDTAIKEIDKLKADRARRVSRVFRRILDGLRQ